jgi:hypothetical protein
MFVCEFAIAVVVVVGVGIGICAGTIISSIGV